MIMKKIMIPPYALLILEEEERALYGIGRYNVVEKGWEKLGDVFTLKADAIQEIECLNKEAGLVTFLEE